MKLVLALLLSVLSTSAFASNSPVIKSTGLIGGAVTQRIYTLERASVRGTVVRITYCPIQPEDAPCKVEIRRDVTSGSIQEAIKKFDELVARDDGD